MGSAILPCGCSYSYDMHSRAILSIHFCLRHVTSPEIQQFLNEGLELFRAIAQQQSNDDDGESERG